MTETIERVLLTSQRNDLFATIQNYGLAPEDFKPYESVRWKKAELTHKPTDYFFRIQIGGLTTFRAIFSPGEELLTEERPCATWSNVMSWFSDWLSNILRETGTPDLWDGLAGENQLIQDTAEQSSDNLAFNQAELPQVRKALEEIKAYVIKTKELTEAQRKIVDARFNHMEEAATRMGRKDWLGLVIGNLLGIAFSLALNGDSTRDLFRFASLVFKRILGAMLYLAGPH